MYKEPFHTKDLSQYTFLVTGGAGFIGSHIVEYLLTHNAGKVIVLDNMANGFESNIELFRSHPNYEFVKGDITDYETCLKVTQGVDYISHQAALGRVPRSIKTPLATHAANATGFLNMLEAAKINGVKRIVYASSSSVFGDSKELPKKEENIGTPLSPYAVSKRVDELYAKVFADVYGTDVAGLRYFNIFGPRQQPGGPYAAAIPIFMDAVLKNEAPVINGDGEQTRDFTFVHNAVQANIKALFTDNNIKGEVFNIAYGQRISINELYHKIAKVADSDLQPKYREPRPGDVRDSLADISKAQKAFDYRPDFDVDEGLRLTFDWFKKTFA
ncbi:MAG TPA: LPS biosynthesis protein WbpP [Flavobacteriales bacterium]|nr:LPS biosynthesis protein WbpP [Flavobacteriales bacterium]